MGKLGVEVCEICNKTSDFTVKTSFNIPNVDSGEGWVCLDCLKEYME